MVGEESGVPPMLSGHFSGSVVVTANLQKNMNPKSLLMALKQSDKQWNWDNLNLSIYLLKFYNWDFIWPDTEKLKYFSIPRCHGFLGPRKILLIGSLLEGGKSLACLDAICAAVVLHKIQASLLAKILWFHSANFKYFSLMILMMRMMEMMMRRCVCAWIDSSTWRRALFVILLAITITATHHPGTAEYHAHCREYIMICVFKCAERRYMFIHTGCICEPSYHQGNHPCCHHPPPRGWLSSCTSTLSPSSASGELTSWHRSNQQLQQQSGRQASVCF